MRSCLTQFTLIVLCFCIIAGGALLFYLSRTTEFSRNDTPQAVLVKPKIAPKAVPVR